MPPFTLTMNVSCINVIIDNPIGNEIAKIIADPLKSNTSLTQLAIRSMMATIIHSLILHISVYVFIDDMCITITIDNRIGNEGAQVIADALKSNRSLVQLEVGGVIATIMYFICSSFTCVFMDNIGYCR